MNTLKFSIEIKAKKEHIWKALWEDQYYRDWVSVFLDGSYAVSEQWKEGSTVLFLGPDNNGRFRKVEILEIHCKKVPVRRVMAGQICSFAVNLGEFAQKWIKNGGEIRRGMVLLDTKC